jgi:5'-nucleotidase, C-terminal domain
VAFAYEPVVRHTMQALPIRSMSKLNSRDNKTLSMAKFRPGYAWLAILFMLGALTLAAPELTAQQTAPIEPCVVKKPCETDATPASKQNSTSRRTATGSRRSTRRRATAHKPTATTQPAKVESRVSGTLIDDSLPADSSVEQMLLPYSSKVRALEIVIGKLDGELGKGSVGAGNLGNFVTDGMRAQSSVRLGKQVSLAITNSGGLRKNIITPGDLRAADIFELLPFENALIEIELTGEQLLNLITVVTEARDAQSGARIKYRMNAEGRPEFISAVLVENGRDIPIDPKGRYTIVTTDYLLKVASGRYSILQQGKDVRPLVVSIRDAIMDYVKAEAAAGRSIKADLDGRFSLVDDSGADSKQ